MKEKKLQIFLEVRKKTATGLFDTLAVATVISFLFWCVTRKSIVDYLKQILRKCFPLLLTSEPVSGLCQRIVYGSVFHWQFLITYIFSVSPKFRACYITGQWGEFTVKNATLYLNILSWHFFAIFHQNICVFIKSFLFWWSVEFPQQNINQSETGIRDKKLSVELHDSLELE